MNEKKQVAIVGAGIVGSTAAYYLSKEKNIAVTIFDFGQGQATKAAAGIISPWFSKRRNKAWYHLAKSGAAFYQTLVTDLEKENIDTSFYQKNGVFLLKNKEEKLNDLLELAQSRKADAPLIGDLSLLSKEQANSKFPELEGFNQLLFASGGARVDGAKLCQSLIEASGIEVISKKVKISSQGKQYLIDDQLFDEVILACGAWLGQILEPLGYQVDIRAQKGQLLDYHFDGLASENFPVVMPEGEIDVIPFPNGKISVGASHENDKGYDLSADDKVLSHLEESAITFYPNLKNASKKTVRIGTRAYSSDFLPFFGKIPKKKSLFAASGLGSSGLTVGPLIGKELANLVKNQETFLNLEQYPIDSYIRLSDSLQKK
ncbi:Glycine oxidase [Streptococcus parauberis]|uniref:Glycine oxidase n=1 Tax=Streptococcus parauberis TaxID=1348 RepID=A0A854WG84_9STRE|nr:FAD-dependent oxidoreductase [Streptococcus parauberis]PCH12582.1 Glycine oxidase [Streptococcus parauberis]